MATAPEGAAPYAVSSPRIRWGAVDVVVTTPHKFVEDLAQFKEDRLFPACIVMDEADMLFAGQNRGYLFDVFAALRPRLKVRQLDEARERLPELVPTQFVFAAATLLHIGPHSAGNMLIERFCTADVVETRHFHRLPTGLLSLDSMRWPQASDDWDRRVDQLLELLRETPCERTLVFVNSLDNCHVLLNFLKDRKWPVVGFMKGRLGRMGPRFRDAQRFASGEVPIMVATEFGGRGIDWAEVDHVVNFQMPTSAVCWLHRVGRTGRMGKRGLVTNFVGHKDSALAALIKVRLAAGKDLHGAFSRRRSLPRRLKAERKSEDDQGRPEEDGSFRLQGGLELFPSGLVAEGEPLASPAAGGADDEAGGDTLIGYLDMPEADEAAGVAGQRMRHAARHAAKAATAPAAGRASGSRDASLSPSAGGTSRGEEADDLQGSELLELRARLLASDSDDSDGPFGGAVYGSDQSDEEDDDPEQGEGDGPEEPGPEAGGFSWASIDDRQASSVVAQPPGRQILNRGPKAEQPDARRYLSPDGNAGGRHKGGVRSANRAAAKRNYPSDDDELLV